MSEDGTITEPGCGASDAVRGEASRATGGPVGETIRFDPHLSNVPISNASCSGYMSVVIRGSVVHMEVTGHDPDDRYRVYQSSISGSVDIGDVGGVESIVTAWDVKARGIGRTPIHNPISATSGATSAFKATIGDTRPSHPLKDSGRTGGLSFNPSDYDSSEETTLVGDNRFSGAFYYGMSSGNDMLTFTVYDDPFGALTVAGATDEKSGNDRNSVIGGSDASTIEESCGFSFNGGTIWAAAHSEDGCKTIGGGGSGRADLIYRMEDSASRDVREAIGRTASETAAYEDVLSEEALT